MVDQSRNTKIFKSKEEVVSMLLGLAIVLVVFILVINFFQSRNKGTVDVPGVSDTALVNKDTPLIVKETSLTPTESIALVEKNKNNVVTQTPKITVKPTIAEQIQNNNNVDKKIYLVKKGDSLWKIALTNYGSGYKWIDIKKANNLSNPGLLAVGQQIVLPEIATTQTITGDTYVVVKGDYLSKIALMAYGDSFAWTKIYEANMNIIKNPSLIRPGWKLVIPR